jgi:hypothetical protein
MYALIFLSLLLIVAALVFVASMFAIVKSMRRERCDVAISPQSFRKHLALVCLVCFPQILLAAALLTLGFLIVLGFLLSLNPFLHHSTSGEVYSVIMWIITLLLAAAIIAKSIDRHRRDGTTIFRNVLRVDTNSVSTFALIFAGFLSHDLYHFMPATTPASMHQHPGLVGVFFDRELLSCLVFWLGWYSIKAVLVYLLEMKPRQPPENLPPPWPASGQTF